MVSKRKSRSYTRGRAKFSVYETVLIVCEGKVTEPNYFNNLIHENNLSSVNLIKVMSGKNSAPIGVVRTAVHTINSNRIHHPYDKVFCVIDRDAHDSFNDALNLARAHNIEIIASYPCFEYWYLCHFKYSGASIVGTGSKTAGEKCIEGFDHAWQTAFNQPYNKAIEKPYSLLKNYLDVALSNARQSLQAAHTTQQMNPSTLVHELVEYLHSLRHTQR